MPTYRLLIGKHVQDNGKGQDVMYNAGDVFVSKVELEKFNGVVGKKFERLHDASVPAAVIAEGEKVGLPPKEEDEYTEEELRQMSLLELRALAANNEIDLKGATRKDEVIRVLIGSV